MTRIDPAPLAAFRDSLVGVHGLHCLVVEDNPTNQFVITLFLRKLGVGHDMVSHGADALALFGGRRFDAVLMDIEMPALDGYETTRELRRRESRLACERTPIIGLSADALPESRLRAHEAGMDEFLTKPIAMDALHGALLAVAVMRPGTGQPI